ncbi:DUF992 domain-containing protein [Amorphus orientalis]|uniref:DUF992 domain-containing protein n=1 Tax=Amorphus orientalis TaxID=649198 RepID=A0AAE4AS55_9HYPH|nr:DUF992 domain-containing protein [Amorphus orientalis]MDQ0313709.1 hypothetical protein [Amorphus orientalis]
MLKSVLTAVAAVTMIAAAAPASAQDRVRVGVLECDVAGGSGFVFGSTKNLTCIYTPAGEGAKETYTGTINKYGIDIGATDESRLVWGVLAAAQQFDPDALEGNYYGASAEATAGVGLGANALVGGFERSVALNPISLQTQTGINIAAGVAELTLAGTN